MKRVTLFAAVSAATLTAFASAAGTGNGRNGRPDYRPANHGQEDEKPPSGGPVTLEVADHREPGSLLLYPEYDNRDGIVSILTVTNTNATNGQTVKVEFKYIDKYDCAEFNRTETLTANDTLSLITNFHNPQDEQGYVYVFAKDSGGPIVWNWLIGNQLMVDGVETFDYSVNPVSFLGVGDAGGTVQPDGTDTDLDGDNNRDLDGKEYSQAPDSLLVPRFLGQGEDFDGEGDVSSELILIALTGGSRFSTRVDFLIYNDNEQIFSDEYEFECWDKPHLLDISGIFSNQFLHEFTDDDPNEIFGQTENESGWFRVDGAVANSTVESILDPAVYCVLIERANYHGVADLPFSIGGQDNGALVPRHIFGDGDPTPVDGDHQ